MQAILSPFRKTAKKSAAAPGTDLDEAVLLQELEDTTPMEEENEDADVPTDDTSEVEESDSIPLPDDVEFVEERDDFNDDWHELNSLPSGVYIRRRPPI